LAEMKPQKPLESESDKRDTTLLKAMDLPLVATSREWQIYKDAIKAFGHDFFNLISSHVFM